MDLNFLYSPPESSKPAEWENPNHPEPEFKAPDLTESLLKLLSAPNIASKESIVRIYDHEVQGGTVIKPLQGENSGPNDAAVMKPLPDSWMGAVLASGMNPNYGKVDPYWMAAAAVEEAVMNCTAVGGRRAALLDNFTWGNPEKPKQLGSLTRACQACYDIAKAFGTPFISGKDSLYNESPLGPITPTLLVTAIGIIPDVRRAISMEFKKSGDSIYVLGQTRPELGGSEYYKMLGHIGRSVPEVRPLESKPLMDSLIKAMDNGLVRACHDISEGGLAVALSEMALGGGLGAEIDLSKIPTTANRDDSTLFSESNGRFLVEVARGARKEFEKTMEGRALAEAGKVSEDGRLKIGSIDVEIEKLEESWKGAL